MDSTSATLSQAPKDLSVEYASESNQEVPYQLSTTNIKLEDITATADKQASKGVQSKAHQSNQALFPLAAEALCPITRASHSSLLQFDIRVCPRCHIHIRNNDEESITRNDTPHSEKKSAANDPIESKQDDILKIDSESRHQIKEIWEDVSWFTRKLKEEMSESDSDDERSGSQDGTSSQGEYVKSDSHGDKRYPGQHDLIGFAHEIEFRDEGTHLLQRKPWERPFNLVDARNKVGAPTRKTIAKITTVLRTNHPSDKSRSGRERRKIAQAGFLRNPKVQFLSIKQRMSLRSKPLIEVLQKIIPYYPQINLKAETLMIPSPFCLLAHYLTELETFKNTFDENTDTLPTSRIKSTLENSTRIAFEHIEKLLHFMRNNMYSTELETELARHSRTSAVCTFPMVWLLYKPGTTVYVSDSTGRVSAYIVETCEVDSELWLTDDMLTPYLLRLWNLSFDGQYVRRAVTSMNIGSFDGERPILDLKIIPARFVDDSDGGRTREKLIQQGRKWYGMLTGAQQWHYAGQTRSSDKKEIDTRVVIDIGAFQMQEPTGRTMGDFKVDDMREDRAICPCEKCLGKRPHPPKDFPWTEYDLIDPAHNTLELPDSYPDRQHRYLLCSGQLVGFALKSRTWEVLDVERCYPAKINTGAIDTLVMPEERKRMIKAIVQKYTDPRFTPGNSAPAWGADFIEKKGEGQIFLLHGGPGVGKTYNFTKLRTECISELIGRPLLSLTCADFGTDEEAMEKRLSQWFKLAEAWGAVMLLDEADVWLERRIISDLKRNTLVAVFLRCLEYYRGILFLTSNRVGTFDDAFISRIHVVIYYEDLGEPQRKQIWKQFFDKLERERKDTIIVESRAKHFVLNDSEMKKIPWNGREIRNAFQTAVSLAEYRYHYEGGKAESDHIVLDKVDFEQVCQMSMDFKDYLKKVHRGEDENDRAMRERARA
ncbi:hypothetical protein F5Y13DRAFT_205079 [Hypoxylon sp. FL1857]|nr:hypothetical protein F5Y13DRAFT_205079 [Hypoxylon sp. FL1857]